ncbi:hypothetical protein [Roseomonas gilardii]|uniref:hypothetical protein n=1 Tax=Roseomonas gilardii TaxID=257708 RepID=UPI001431125B|nr:hypothetical protein [Roseomonas gilardii]
MISHSEWIKIDMIRAVYQEFRFFLWIMPRNLAAMQKFSVLAPRGRRRTPRPPIPPPFPLAMLCSSLRRQGREAEP